MAGLEYDFEYNSPKEPLINLTGSSVWDTATSLVKMQNALMDRELKARELAGPSPREKWEAQQRQQQTTQMFSMWTSLLKEPNLSPEAREHTVRTMEQVYHFLTPFEKAGLRPWMTSSFLDETQKKLRMFDEENQMPQEPRDKDLQVLPRTRENLQQWAKYEMLSAEWQHKRALVGYGKDKADELSPLPKMIPIQLGDAGPGEMWYAMRDQTTGKLVTIDIGNFPIAEVQQAIKEGRVTPWDLMNQGGTPFGEVYKGMSGGRQFETSNFYDFKTGRARTITRDVGPGGDGSKDSTKTVPSDLRQALMATIGGDKEPNKKLLDKMGFDARMLYDEFKRTEEIPAMLEEGGKKKKNPEFEKALTKLQATVSSVYPGYVVFPAEEGLKQSMLGFGDSFYLEGTKWLLKKEDGKRQFTVFDSKGNPQTAEFWWNNKSGMAFDKSGRDIPETKGKSNGDVVDIKVRNRVSRNASINLDLPADEFAAVGPWETGTANAMAMALQPSFAAWDVVRDSMGIEQAKAQFQGLLAHHGGLTTNLTPENVAAAWHTTVEKAREFLEFMSKTGPLGGGY